MGFLPVVSGLRRRKTVTKKDIIEIVARKTGHKKNHIKIITECVFDVFTERLATERRMEIRNFGVFKVKDTPARIGRNPISKEAADVPARRIVQFKAGKTMKEQVNSIEEQELSAPYGETPAAIVSPAEEANPSTSSNEAGPGVENTGGTL
jgi:integration host factor subunit beta